MSNLQDTRCLGLDDSPKFALLIETVTMKVCEYGIIFYIVLELSKIIIRDCNIACFTKEFRKLNLQSALYYLIPGKMYEIANVSSSSQINSLVPMLYVVFKENLVIFINTNLH